MFKTFCLSAAIALSATFALAGDPVINFADDDPEMNAAISKARNSMELFLQHATDASGTGLQGSLVKAALKTDYGFENIWIQNFKRHANGQISGELANEPNDLPGKHLGDRVTFDPSALRDWSLWIDGKLYGNYSTRVMLPRMDETTRQDLSEILSNAPIPADW